VALRRTCRCTEFHRVKNANLRHPSAMCYDEYWCVIFPHRAVLCL